MEVFGRAARPDQQTVDFVTALTSLSAFFDVSPQEVSFLSDEGTLHLDRADGYFYSLL